MEAATKATPESYETAVARLEQIIARLDSGEAELRETLALCTEAKGLIEHCKTELDAVSGELTELQLDQLVAELERRRPPKPPDGARELRSSLCGTDAALGAGISPGRCFRFARTGPCARS